MTEQNHVRVAWCRSDRVGMWGLLFLTEVQQGFVGSTALLVTSACNTCVKCSEGQREACY